MSNFYTVSLNIDIVADSPMAAVRDFRAQLDPDGEFTFEVQTYGPDGECDEQILFIA